MRRQHFAWTFLVISILLIMYGGYFIIYRYIKEDTFDVFALIALIVGSAMLILFLVLSSISKSDKNQNKDENTVTNEETQSEEMKDQEEEVKKEALDTLPKQKYRQERKDDYSYTPKEHKEHFASGYVSQVGKGPILEVNGSTIRDMRNNVYYRIDGNHVYINGSGLAFEISNNRIKKAFGSYLYELSGNSINKVFGGFFASISGGYITKYDSSIKYEIDTSLNKKQIMVIVAILFGEY